MLAPATPGKQMCLGMIPPRGHGPNATERKWMTSRARNRPASRRAVSRHPGGEGAAVLRRHPKAELGSSPEDIVRGPGELMGHEIAGLAFVKAFAEVPA